MYIEKKANNEFIISDIIGEGCLAQYVQKHYIYYTKREAISMFKKHIRSLFNEGI